MVKVYLPGPNKSRALPFEKNNASCDSWTINCDIVLKFVLGYLHIRLSSAFTFFITSNIAIIYLYFLFGIYFEYAYSPFCDLYPEYT